MRRKASELQTLSDGGWRFCLNTSRWEEIAEEVENPYHKELVRLYTLASLDQTAARVSRFIGKSIEETKFAALVSLANSMHWHRFANTKLAENVRKGKYVAGKMFMQYATFLGEWRPETEWQRNQEATVWDKGFFATEGRKERYGPPKRITIEEEEGEQVDANIA